MPRAGDPLDAHTLATRAAGVATRAYAGTLDPLPPGGRERSVTKSSLAALRWALDETYALADPTLADRGLFAARGWS